MSYNDALDLLPYDALWSSCFGYPGQGGYVEYYRTKDGTRYVVSNGAWDEIKPFVWTVKKVN